jgi:murein DD-endopeptidase MepM/ murein hydrolase activator NlpD
MRIKHSISPKYLANILLLVTMGCKTGASRAPTTIPDSQQVPGSDYQLFTHTPPNVEIQDVTEISPTNDVPTTPESITLDLPDPTSTPTSPYPCSPQICTYPGHFWMHPPIAPNKNDRVDPTYRYGSTQEGTRPTHHGVEFVNPEGTPVLAAADGLVIVAGNDYEETYADFPFYYGNLVIIEHSFTGIDVPVFTLYGHLSKVDTQVGTHVHAGDQIGAVGYTGVAEWSHLHFEVRVGYNQFNETRNPELWLKPHQNEDGEFNGGIAGRIVDEFGMPIHIPNVVVERMAPGDVVLETVYVETYADLSVKGDDTWGENFALSNLQPGKYRVSFVARGLQVWDVTVYPGQLTLLTFDARNP